MSRSSLPPRFVPTLTEVVQQGATRPLPAASAVSESASADLGLLQEQMIHRVMQRIDLTLDRLLRETVGRVVANHTQSLGPILREEIELVVRQSVDEAFEKELGNQPPSGA